MYDNSLLGSAYLTACVAALFVQSADAQLTATTTRISVSSSGAQGNGASAYGRISSDGRAVAFSSTGDFGIGNNRSQIYLRDLANDTLELVSKSPGGVAGSLDSYNPVPSNDGRRVAFMSWSSNLDPLDLNNTADVFLHDRKTHKTYTISISLTGGVGAGPSTDPDITEDGRYVCFRSDGANLVAGDTNGMLDVFRRDTLLNVTELVSVEASGLQGTGHSGFSSISADGRFIAFESGANNFAGGLEIDYTDDIFLKDMLTGALIQVSKRADGSNINEICDYPVISADGTKVAFRTNANSIVPGDTGGYWDIFVYDLTSGSIGCATRTSTGGFANDGVVSGRLSRDGLFVCFDNPANQIVPGDNNSALDVFVRDLTLGTTTLMSVSTALPTVALGGQQPDVASGGWRTVFHSSAGQLVAGDTNGVADVFLRDLSPWTPYSYCAGKVNSLGCRPAIACTGQSSATSISGLTILGSQVLNNRPGILLYSISGKSTTPFQGGTLCVAAPIGRTPASSSGGSPSPIQDCSGILSLDFNAFALGQLGGNPFFELQIPGTLVCSQWWSRDTGFPAGQASSLTNALSFTILP